MYNTHYELNLFIFSLLIWKALYEMNIPAASSF